MPILIGTDEAGYGPNLGPLVITATSWTVPDNLDPAELWSCLTDVVSNEPPNSPDLLHVGDSKQVYNSGRSIEPLERSVLAFLSLLRETPQTIDILGAEISGREFGDAYAEEPWNDGNGFAVPVAANVEQLPAMQERLRSCLEANSIRLNAVFSRVVFPVEFNRLVDEAGTKGQVLSAATLALVRRCTDAIAEPVRGTVVCDKHGGRNRYDGLIAQAFDDQFVFRTRESGPISSYRVGELQFCFRTKAEQLLPVALASMVSKYVREILMMQFNEFWQSQLPSLKPTKGYPTDAKRFWQDIAGTARDLQIEKHRLWRQR
ncbi:MAG: hypothetical protein R3C19_20640 [Planctomycetaceae bacterium]